jgi:hypothetical protein
MSNGSIRRNVISGVSATIISLLLFVPNANSQSKRESDAVVNEQKLQARVALLENRLGALEDRLRLLEQGEHSNTTPTASKTSMTSTTKKPVDGCASPSYLDNMGVRHVRRECLQESSLANCETPFVVDPDGIKRVKPDCI